MTSANADRDVVPSHRVTIVEHLQLLWSKKAVLLTFLILGGWISYLVASLMTPQFEANALVQLENKKSGIGLSSDFSELVDPESSAVTEIVILQSRLVVGQVVDQLGLQTVARPNYLPFVGNYLARHFYPKPNWVWLEKWAWHGEKISVENFSLDDKWIDATLTIEKTSDERFKLVLPDDQVHQGTVGQPLSTPDGKVELTVQSLTGAVGTHYILKRVSRLGALAKLRQKLSVKEKSKSTGILEISIVNDNPVAAKDIANNLILAFVEQNIGRSSEEAQRSLQFLEAQLPIVKGQVERAESELNEFKFSNESIDLNREAEVSLERVVTLDSQLSLLSLEEKELSRSYTKNHPRYQSLLEKRRQLTSEKDRLIASTKELPAIQQQALNLMKDLEVNQEIYLQLLNKTQELNIVKASEIGTIRVIDEAEVNPRPVEPNVSNIVLVSSLMAAALSALFILFRSMYGQKVDSPEDLAETGLPLYAVVPDSKIQRRNDSNQQTRFTLLARDHSNEMAIEALRSLRTSLHFGLLEKEAGVVAVIGASPNVGKSFVASNLAFLAATAGQRVLLIDGDLRKGRLGNQFNLPRSANGLSEVISGKNSLADSIQDIAALEALENVVSGPATMIDELDFDDKQLEEEAEKSERKISIVPRGKVPPNPSELLMHERFGRIIGAVSKKYDLVIIDTPPVLAVTDTLLIAKHTDMNLLILRQGQSTVDETKEVISMFDTTGLKISGVVMNGYESRKSRYGNKYGYRYSYS